MRTTRKRAFALVAGMSTIALLASACGTGSDDTAEEPAGDGGETTDEEITLTISTFNEWGYDTLLDQYMEEHPNITIEHNKFATSNEARDQFNTSLAAGSGLADVVGVEVDWMPEIMQYADQFVDLTSDSVEGRWQDWKVGQATTPDGKLVGYGTDIGPEAIAYRADLFAAAGLPSDREAVAELFGGEDATWDDFFAVGEQFTAAGTGVPFYDSGAAIYQGLVNQIEVAYEDPESGEIIAIDNPEVRDAYDAVMAHTDLSAGLQQWSEDWTNSFQTNGFAVMLAPSWMLGVISGNAEGVTGWDVANVFPGGGGNWGGSFLTVPTQSEHPEEAKALADWLTAPEQQLVAFQTTGNFPSQVEAQNSDELKAITNEFFNNAPVGEIMAERSAAVTVAPYKSTNYFAINDAMAQAINRVEVDGTDDAESSWAKWVEAVEAL